MASLPVKMPPAAITGISRCSLFRYASTSAMMVARSYCAQSMPKPRWPPASGPSTTTKSGRRLSLAFLRRNNASARADETMMPSLASRKRGWSSINANEPRCRPAERVMPSTPASSAADRRTRRVSRGEFMVSFSMQLTKIMPEPCLASMVFPTWLRVASSSTPRLKCTPDLSLLATLALYCLSFWLTNLVSYRVSDTACTRASEI